jgi:hypothetical protein
VLPSVFAHRLLARIPSRTPRDRRRGMALVVAALALVALLGGATLSFDVGREAVAAQRARHIAASAALAGAEALPAADLARSRALGVIAANNVGAGDWAVTLSPDTDIRIIPPNTAATGLGGALENLGSQRSAIQVTCHSRSQGSLTGLLGLAPAGGSGSATAVCVQQPGRVVSLVR